MTMIARSAATRAVSRVVTSQQTRCLSTKEPKLHMAKGRWGALKAKRPIDHDEEHVRNLRYSDVCKIPNSTR